MNQHPEAFTAATSTSCWALIYANRAGKYIVLEGTSFLMDDCKDLGFHTDDIALPHGFLDPGFHVWEGASHFDGLDGTEYERYSIKRVDLNNLQQWLDKAKRNYEDDNAEHAAGPTGSSEVLDF